RDRTGRSDSDDAAPRPEGIRGLAGYSAAVDRCWCDCHVAVLRAWKREQRARSRWDVLSRSRRNAWLRGPESRRHLPPHIMAARRRPGEQPLRHDLLHERPARTGGLQRAEDVYRAAISGGEWRIPSRAHNVLCAWRARARLARCTP